MSRASSEVLTIFLVSDYIPTPVREGRFLGVPWRWDRCGARGRARHRLALGRRWELRPAGHYEPPARSWLTTGIAGESAARRRKENAAVERRKASIPIARDAPPTQSSRRRLRKLVCSRQLVRLSALRSPRCREGRMRRQANPAPFKQYGRRSVGCLTIEYGRKAARCQLVTSSSSSCFPSRISLLTRSACSASRSQDCESVIHSGLSCSLRSVLACHRQF